MKTNIPIEQAIIGQSNAEKSERIHAENRKQITASVERKSTYSNDLAELENGPMMSTAEILDFASGIDSTEYDQS